VAAYAQAARRWAAVAVSDAPTARRPAVEASDAPEPQPEAQESDAAEPQRAAVAQGSAAAVVPLPEAGGRDAQAELPQEEAALDVPARQPAAHPSAVHPSVAASVCRRDQLLAALEPRRAARSAHAMQRWRAASLLARSWQAARDEGLS
jgi:hypothetical protein